MSNNEIKNLKSTDLYSLMLFALYKLANVPEYSALSELIYFMDKDSFLNLCEFFGGCTIKIPTIHDLEMLTNALLLYQNVNIDGMEYDKAIDVLGIDTTEMREVKTNYNKLCEVLKKYNFNLHRSRD